MIETQFAEPLTLGGVAQTVDVHPVTLARCLSRYTGETFGEIIRRKRIEFACREIVRGDQSLVEIALRAGFYNQSHFTKIFKSLTGKTPAEFQTRRKS